ncbi:hypothetical protein [Streptomyces sp. cg40]
MFEKWHGNPRLGEDLDASLDEILRGANACTPTPAESGPDLEEAAR